VKKKEKELGNKANLDSKTKREGLRTKVVRRMGRSAPINRGDDGTGTKSEKT